MKIANLVFNEHEKLVKTDSLQKEEIRLLSEAVQYSFQLDSIYDKKEAEYKSEIDKTKKKLKKSKTWNSVLGAGFIGSLAAFVISIL